MNDDLAGINQRLTSGHDINELYDVATEAGVEKMTLLISAVANQKEHLVPVLLERGADPNLASPSSGNMPLHTAAKNGLIEAAKALVDAGADPTAKNHAGLTPFERAQKLNQTAFVEVVGRYVADHAAKQAQAEAAAGWAGAQSADTLDAYLSFVATHGGSEHVGEAVDQVLARASQADEATREAVYEKLADAYPPGLDRLPANTRVLYIGPAGMRVKDILALGKTLNKNVVAARIRSSEYGYKIFTLEELGTLKKLGVADEIVTAMIDVTSKIEEQAKADAASEALKAEIAALKALVEQQAGGSSGAGAQAAGGGQTVNTADGPMDMVASCAKRLAALQLCNQVPFPGSTVCKTAAEANFPCAK